MRVPTRLRTHTRARASAAPPRTTARAASTTRRARPACTGRAAGAEKAAHTWCNVVTEAVFHAPMLALNAVDALNACEPSHTRSTPMEGARMCRRGCVGAQLLTRTHTDAARGRVCAAGPHRRSVHLGSLTRVDIDICHASCIIMYLCTIPVRVPSTMLRNEHAALAHMPRVRASSAPARDRTRTQERTPAPIYEPGLCIDVYMCVCT